MTRARTKKEFNAEDRRDRTSHRLKKSKNNIPWPLFGHLGLLLLRGCTFTVTFFASPGAISIPSACSRNGLRTAGLDHSKLQPFSIAISKYLPGRMSPSAKVPSLSL